MSDNQKDLLQKGHEESILLADTGISSEAQKELSAWRRFVSSSVFWVIVFELFLIVVFSSINSNFLSVNNLFNIALNASQMIILSVGVTYAITAGHFDLSIGMNLIFSSIIAAKVFKAVAGTPAQIVAGEYPNMALGIILAVFAALVAGSIGGVMNAFFTSKLSLPPFIATLGSMNILQGISMVISNGAAEVNLPRTLQTKFGHAKLMGIVPYPLILALFIGVSLLLIMKHTRFGLYVKAMGSNSESARRAGINITRYTFYVYILVGLCSALGGMIDLTRFATTNPSGHTLDGLQAVMAVVMGGTSMKGGIASVGGTMLAALIPVTLQIGMVVIRVSSFYQMIATGIILVIAVYLDYRRNMQPIG